MNTDYTFCFDYREGVCPLTCFRAEITYELNHSPCNWPTSWAKFKGTEECPMKGVENADGNYCS